MRKAIRRHRQFEKNFRKRITNDPQLFEQFEARLQLFMDGVRGAPLHDHALSGHLQGQRAFSISGDVCVVYVEAPRAIDFIGTPRAIVFVDIGTHNQVCGR